MNLVDTLGHVFYLFLFIGMLGIAFNRRVGWWFRITGELGWGVLGAILGLSSIVIWSIIFAAVDILGLYRWTMKEYDENLKR